MSYKLQNKCCDFGVSCGLASCVPDDSWNVKRRCVVRCRARADGSSVAVAVQSATWCVESRLVPAEWQASPLLGCCCDVNGKQRYSLLNCRWQSYSILVVADIYSFWYADDKLLLDVSELGVSSWCTGAGSSYLDVSSSCHERWLIISEAKPKC